MWVIAEYQPVALFSLKHALATSSGGKSLLVPTPFAVKMALLDAACRLWGVKQAREIWPDLRELRVAIRPPQHAVVTNLFAKILKPRRNPAKPGSPHAGPLGPTIAYREYVWAEDSLALALGCPADHRVNEISALLPQINYLGKRGGFVQLQSPPKVARERPETFTLLNPRSQPESFDSRGLLQLLDDCGEQMTFAHADIYSSKGIRLGKERILRHVVLPYRMIRSTKSYTLYERFDDTGSDKE